MHVFHRLPKRESFVLRASVTLGLLLQVGCARVRQLNSPDSRLRYRVEEATRLHSLTRIELQDGEMVEGVLVHREWPHLFLESEGSKIQVDGRQVVGIWRRGVSKHRGLGLGAAIGSVPFAILGYSLAKHPICFYGPCEPGTTVRSFTGRSLEGSSGLS